MRDRTEVLDFARKEFGSEPEYLWARYPDYAVLRRADSGKWYAALMDVPREKLGLPGEGRADILVFKCDARMVGSLLRGGRYLPAYHMNRSNWITAPLGAGIPSEETAELLRLAYELVGPKRGR